MNRRYFLRALSATGLVGLAGCVGNIRGGLGNGGNGSDGSGDTPDKGRNIPDNVDLPIPRDQLTRGAPKDAIPAIIEPKFADDWEGVEVEVRDGLTGSKITSKPRVRDIDIVIGVEREGEARSYPLKVLNWHEVVNDNFNGPLLVTYCPLCGSGVTAVREVDGEETVFGVSGLLWKSDLVMYDKRTESLWSQILATAINGPKTGETLDLLPSTLTTWGEWRKTHPDSKVLLPPPISGTVVGEAPRHYEINPYEGYDDSRRIGIGSDEFEDDRLHPKRLVLGIRASGVAKAYPLNKVKEEKVINDKVGNLPVVVAVGPDNTLVSYVRRLNGKEFRFKPDGNRHMRGGGSRWLINTGRAVDGPHEGETLKKANEMTPMFWFAWLDFNPETTVYGNE